MDKNKIEPILFICDDFVGSAINMRNGYISQLFTDCRHIKVSIISIIHDLRKIDPMSIN